MTGAGRARRRDGEALHAPISQNRRSTIWTLRSSASARTSWGVSGISGSSFRDRDGWPWRAAFSVT